MTYIYIYYKSSWRVPRFIATFRVLYIYMKPYQHIIVYYFLQILDTSCVGGKSSVMPHGLLHYILIISKLILPIDSDILVYLK